MASSGVLVEPGQRDKLAAMISCNSMKSYWIDSCNKSITTGQISQLSRNRVREKQTNKQSLNNNNNFTGYQPVQD